MTVIITLIVFILLILIIVWGPFLSRKNIAPLDSGIRDTTNKDLYHEHKAEIELDFQQDKIDQENYQYLLTELDKSLLQDMEENQKNSVVIDNKGQQLSIVWPILLSLFVLVFSFMFYQKHGAFEQLSQPKVEQHSSSQQNSEQMELVARVKELKAQITATPQNSQLWYGLGQTLVAMGDFDNALKAFDKTIEIEGLKADLIGAKAQALYYKSEQKITADVERLIDQALALDPTDASTNILLGIHAFGINQYKDAINYWQGVIDAKKSVNVAALEQAINEAKSRLGLSSNNDVVSNEIATDVQGLTLYVSLSEEIEQAMIESADKTVFIYAIPASGPRMPVAAVKVQASDLPLTVVLDDSRAMNPQMKISNFEQVHVFAVISQQGTPGIKSGDYTGRIDNINVNNSDDIDVVINTVTP